MLSSEELCRYERQLRLEGFGVDAQEKLKSSRVAIVGVGGLGAPAALYLAGAGVGTLGLIDEDVVNISNLHRQILFRPAHVGEAKVSCASSELSELNPHIAVHEHKLRLSSQNVCDVFAEYDLIIDGSDNFPTRYLVNDACVVLEKSFISAAIFKFEGQLGVFNTIDGEGGRSATYRCLYPQPPPIEERPSCADLGVLGVVPGVMGMLQATEAIKLITGVGAVQMNCLVCWDFLTLSMRKIKVARDEKACAAVVILNDYESLGKCAVAPPITVKGKMEIDGISPRELKALLDKGERVELIDIREEFERDICHIGGLHIPMSSVMQYLDQIPREGKVIFYCRAGTRSRRVIEELARSHGYKNLLNLEGGINRWSDEVDPSLQKY